MRKLTQSRKSILATATKQYLLNLVRLTFHAGAFANVRSRHGPLEHDNSVLSALNSIGTRWKQIDRNVFDRTGRYKRSHVIAFTRESGYLTFQECSNPTNSNPLSVDDWEASRCRRYQIGLHRVHATLIVDTQSRNSSCVRIRRSPCETEMRETVSQTRIRFTLV